MNYVLLCNSGFLRESKLFDTDASQKLHAAVFWLSHSVESSDVNWKKKKSGGIKIICQSEVRDFSAMAFITDHVNSLIDQWFPGKRITVIFCAVLCLFNRRFFDRALQVHDIVC